MLIAVNFVRHAKKKRQLPVGAEFPDDYIFQVLDTADVIRCISQSVSNTRQH